MKLRSGIIICLLVLSAMKLSAQDIYFTRTGKIDFHAGTTVEDIDATNNEVASVLDISKGDMAFNVLIKSFHFRRTLMEEHFNENYLESTKYPKAVFKGKIVDNGKVLLPQHSSLKADPLKRMHLSVSKPRILKLQYPALWQIKYQSRSV
jgi:hypothetical protein